MYSIYSIYSTGHRVSISHRFESYDEALSVLQDMPLDGIALATLQEKHPTNGRYLDLDYRAPENEPVNAEGWAFIDWINEAYLDLPVDLRHFEAWQAGEDPSEYLEYLD